MESLKKPSYSSKPDQRVEITREQFFAEGSYGKQLVKDVLRQTDAAELGIKAGGGRRRPETCAVNMIFREPRGKERTGVRSLNVGRKELLMEFSPGHKPPTHLRLRVVGGEAVEDNLVTTMANTFLAIKAAGIFEDSFEQGLRATLVGFISKVRASIHDNRH